MILSCLLSLFTFYPGHMSNDSLEQFAQAISGSFTLWHPPIMSFLWSFLFPSTLGPLPLLVLQIIIFVSSFMFIACYVTKRTTTRIVIFSSLFLFPAIFVQPGMIWKDVQMSAALLLATALLMAQERQQRINVKILILVILALFYATSVRLNGFLAIVPLLLWQCVLCFPAERRPMQWYYWCVFPLVCGCLFMASMIVTNALVSEPSPPPSQQIKIHDLAALSLASQSMLLPVSVQKMPLTIPLLGKLYSPSSNNPLIFSQYIQLLTDNQALDDLDSTWKQAVAQYPLQYLSHRKSFFRFLLSYRTPTVCYPWHEGIDKNNFGLNVTNNPIAVGMLAFLASLKNSFFFRGWLYLLLCAVLCIVQGTISLWRRQIRGSFCLSLSGLCYGLPYFFVGTSCDFRYLYWVIIASLLSLVLFLFEQSSERLEAP